jgi:Zn-dependent protease
LATTSSSPRSEEDNRRVVDLVHQRFLVTSQYFREDFGIEFYLDPIQENVKSKFVSLVGELKKIGDSSLLRRLDNGYRLTVIRKPIQVKQRSRLPLILLIATLGTIAGDGFYMSHAYSDPYTSHLSTISEITVSILFTVSLFGIIAVHEMGHKIASWYHKMDSSWPYFIPGIPGIWPTMGAVISARDPPTNRDSLFDLGISGPIAGLAVTLVVSIVAVLTAKVAPLSSLPSTQALGSTDLYTGFLVGLIKAPPSNYLVYGGTFTILYFAYSFGFLLTFINLLPAWQLDGGHISNAAVSPKVHKVLTYVSVVIMILIQFYLMAFLILLLSGRAPALQPLDTVSPLSPKRKAFFVLALVMAAAILAFVLYDNAFFGLGLLIK